MKTKAESVSGKVSIWAVPSSEFDREYHKKGPFEYLKTLAVARLYLDNFANLQASWVTQGLRIGQVALRFGANDVGSTMIEENVVAAAGVAFSVGAGDLVAAIRAAGYTPAQRRTDYSLVRTFD